MVRNPGTPTIQWKIEPVSTFEHREKAISWKNARDFAHQKGNFELEILETQRPTDAPKGPYLRAFWRTVSRKIERLDWLADLAGFEPTGNSLFNSPFETTAEIGGIWPNYRPQRLSPVEVAKFARNFVRTIGPSLQYRLAPHRGASAHRPGGLRPASVRSPAHEYGRPGRLPSACRARSRSWRRRARA